ncbi:hypothetical protein F4859DRAFT_509747 [Xylaria cf. heliscus]|nr:hypothetical protein F4859DRAFT_509747 [Xylaria cf. heliscus]
MAAELIPVDPNDDLPNPVDMLTALMELEKNNPSTWVCEACCMAHEVPPIPDELANWDEFIFCSCPRIPEDFSRNVYNTTTGYRLDPRLYSLHHRHLQLTMKWARLRDKAYNPIFNTIMGDRALDNIEPYIYCESPDPKIPMVQYQTFPKIVFNHNQLRFLVKSKWTFTNAG